MSSIKNNNRHTFIKCAVIVLGTATILDGPQPRHAPFLGQGRRVRLAIPDTSHRHI